MFTRCLSHSPYLARLCTGVLGCALMATLLAHGPAEASGAALRTVAQIDW